MSPRMIWRTLKILMIIFLMGLINDTEAGGQIMTS